MAPQYLLLYLNFSIGLEITSKNFLTVGVIDIKVVDTSLLFIIVNLFDFSILLAHHISKFKLVQVSDLCWII